MKKKLIGSFLLLSALTVGCVRTGTSNKENDQRKQAVAQDNKYILGEEPAGAKDVLEVKTQAKNGDEVVIVGRIGGSVKPFTGRAAFTIVDMSLKSCSDREGDNCPFPWDYCCEAPDDLAKATVLVKFVDENGKTLAQDAKESMSLKELQTVVVRGVARRNGNGESGDSGITILGSGLFVRK
ncbi:MAG: hypothetical protein HY040_27035 [Planctomycetes bacterium]|nr:hypothetical protein [Planctomycetota bacterium]